MVFDFLSEMPATPYTAYGQYGQWMLTFHWTKNIKGEDIANLMSLRAYLHFQDVVTLASNSAKSQPQEWNTF